MTRNLPNLVVSILIVGFLIFYSGQKYLAAAPASFNLTYVISVVLLVALTALIPVAITCFATRIVPGKVGKLVTAAVLPLALAAAGFWVYWAAFLNPSYGVPLEVVMPRALFPGVTLGGLMVARVLVNPSSGADAPHSRDPVIEG